MTAMKPLATDVSPPNLEFRDYWLTASRPLTAEEIFADFKAVINQEFAPHPVEEWHFGYSFRVPSCREHGLMQFHHYESERWPVWRCCCGLKIHTHPRHLLSNGRIDAAIERGEFYRR